MNAHLESSWKELLAEEFAKGYFKQLTTVVTHEYTKTTVYPPQELIFNAFAHCSFNKLSVVILGQDPYHNTDQAHGLAFSVPNNIPIPPSLMNIYKELAADLNLPIRKTGNLESWADQGVLLLNTTLTVRAHRAFSHKDFGWEQFTDAVITTISKQKEQVVFLLWGAPAIKKRILVDETKHLVLTAPHPSPLSAYRGFFGCRHFSKTNDYLRRHNRPEIIW